jgi:hypothetical protein
MSESTEKQPPASTLFHRALLALIAAGSFMLAAYHAAFIWYFSAPALVFLGIGIWYLKRGSDRWREQA